MKVHKLTCQNIKFQGSESSTYGDTYRIKSVWQKDKFMCPPKRRHKTVLEKKILVSAQATVGRGDTKNLIKGNLSNFINYISTLTSSSSLPFLCTFFLSFFPLLLFLFLTLSILFILLSLLLCFLTGLFPHFKLMLLH